MSSFENLMENGEKQGESFVTRVGEVTVTHDKPSKEKKEEVSSDMNHTCSCHSHGSSHGDSDESDREEKEEGDESKLPPAERNVTPRDVTEINDEDETIYIVGTQGNKVTRLHNIENMTNLKELTCRSCLIGSMDGIVQNHSSLRKLELYDNYVQKFSNLEFLTNLVILDMSYNSIRDMQPVEACVHLEELYLAQNKLRRIQGVNNLKKLRILDLGANRIRVIDAVTSLTSLKSLWLGKNKIESIPDLSDLQALRQLDIQSNRLTSLGTGLQNLFKLEELYLASNNLQSLDGLPCCSVDDVEQAKSSPELQTLDVTSNKIDNLEPITHLSKLEELWMSNNSIATTESLMPLQTLPVLSCLYLENTPLQARLKLTYKTAVLSLLPRLKQLDASFLSNEEH